MTLNILDKNKKSTVKKENSTRFQVRVTQSNSTKGKNLIRKTPLVLFLRYIEKYPRLPKIKQIE